MASIHISKDPSGQITSTFPYDPPLVAKVKTTPRHRWHPEGKYWSFPLSDGIIEKLLKVFEGETIHIGPAPNFELSTAFPKYTHTIEKEEFETEPTPKHNLEDLRREKGGRSDIGY